MTPPRGLLRVPSAEHDAILRVRSLDRKMAPELLPCRSAMEGRVFQCVYSDSAEPYLEFSPRDGPRHTELISGGPSRCEPESATETAQVIT